MSTVRKYAGLPDLDPAPDIYETPELTDDTSTHPTSTTLRSESPASSFHEDDNSGIDRQRLDADEARTHFLPPEQRDQNVSGRINSKRKSYRSSSKRRRRKDTPDINGVINGLEVSSDDEEESLERKIARLRREVEEVKGVFEQRKEKSVNGTAKEIHNEAESLDALSQVLDSVGSIAAEDETGAASRLQKKLASTAKASGNLANGQSADSTRQDIGSPTYTVTYAPNYQEDHALSKVSDFESRLALIEAALGIDAMTLPTQDRSAAKAMIPTLDSLDKQLNTLSNSTDSSLDRISRRVRHLTVDAEKLERARKSAKAAQEALSPASNGPRSAGLASEAGIPEVEDHESMSKINALYGTLPTIESLAPLLPSVLDRLRSLRILHADAASASQTLSKVESRQEAMKDELQGWREGLEKVEKAMEQGEQTMKGNTEMVEGWVKELEERMRKIV
ncbi:nuclear migration protein JNM1, partial [Lecanoromycetidae sp. Uapishka_2]